jgi:hypothetical protein
VTLLGNTISLPAGSSQGPVVPPVSLVSTKASIILSEICHPDITGKTLRSWGLVTFVPGGYTKGGIPMGLTTYLDVRTVDFFGFLKCDVWDEEPIIPGGLFEYHYSPVGDVLQIFNPNGTELSNNQVLPVETLADIVLFEVTVDRTSVRG